MENPGALTEVLRGFLSEVEVAFQDDREKFDEFYKLWVDFKFRRIHESVFRSKLNRLFVDHKDLLWDFIKLFPKPSESKGFASKFFKAVKLALKDDYDDFSKVMEDYSKRKIDERCLLARLKVLLRGHANLIREFNTLFLPTRSHITVPTIPLWDQLPWDVLDVISQKLDFDDLFQFSRVCTDWRVFHKSIDKSKFLTSQEPLLLEFLNSPVKLPYSFTSLPNQKVYPLNSRTMMNVLSYSTIYYFPIFVTYSSGYFVIIADNSSFLLINPFTQIQKKVMCPSTFKFSFPLQGKYRALLAFDKCSEEEFVLLFLFEESNRLHVYQSRNNGWVTYSTCDVFDNTVVDFVVFNNIIYLVTDEARIGVLSLNLANIKFLDMQNTPQILERELHFPQSSLNLVTCDGELLLVRLNPMRLNTSGPPLDRKVYKIDFSTMTYVGLETLGDVALFYVCFQSCKALSNPIRWGYESNSVYEVCSRRRCRRRFCCENPNPNCTVYNWDKKSEKYIAPLNPKTKDSIFLWCFRHLKYEVDCSL